MEHLLLKSITKINTVSTCFYRYLFQKINLKNRLISILGARGVGKTTLLLQLAQQQKKEVLYVSLDDLFFTDNTLYSLAENANKIGINYLYLDEVHKYPNWSRELKLIYDDFVDLHLVFTSSSILDIYRGESDLSRRAISYQLKELSFREYLIFYENIELPILSLESIINNHTTISLQIAAQIKPLKYYQDYLKKGNYPYFSDNIHEYYQQILNTINLILDVDLQSIKGIDYNNISKIKRLLYVISTNVPFTPNISSLALKTGMNRNLLVQSLQLLEKAELIHALYKQTNSISSLNKPNKIWLHNTNLIHALSRGNTNNGNERETFFLQHIAVNHSISLPGKGDFLIDNIYTFEIGGKNKTLKQIKNINNAYLVKDNVEIGILNSIPLWLFGFLY